jgi:aspartyl-tRNA(Asn)/glutamyl-tRNA(Gln) amidotransferase subunit C
VSPLTRDDVAHVAALARLSLSDEELDRYTHQLAAVLDHAEDLAQFDLSDVEPTAHPHATHGALREDAPVACLDRDEVLAQAPRVEDERFCVPRIIGEAP